MESNPASIGEALESLPVNRSTAASAIATNLSRAENEKLLTLLQLWNAIQPLDLRVFDGSEFQAGEEVGRGISYRVFRQQHRHTREVFAIKQLRVSDGPSQDATRMRCIYKDIVVMQYPPLAVHDNIVHLEGYGWNASSKSYAPFLVLEYAVHNTMRAFLRDMGHQVRAAQQETEQELQKGPLAKEQRPYSFILRLCSNVRSGLIALHEHNVFHGDVKLENVLITITERGDAPLIAKLCDFGHVCFKPPTQMTVKAEQLAGTVAYMAPETLGRDRSIQVDPAKCDVWSFGLLIWESFLYGEHYLDKVSHELLCPEVIGYRNTTQGGVDKVAAEPVTNVLYNHKKSWEQIVPAALNTIDSHKSKLMELDWRFARAIIRHCLQLEPSLRYNLAALPFKYDGARRQEPRTAFDTSQPGLPGQQIPEWSFQDFSVANARSTPQSAKTRLTAWLTAGVPTADTALYLAYAYATGYGVNLDMKECKMWLKTAIELKSSVSGVILDILDGRGNTDLAWLARTGSVAKDFPLTVSPHNLDCQNCMAIQFAVISGHVIEVMRLMDRTIDSASSECIFECLCTVTAYRADEMFRLVWCRCMANFTAEAWSAFLTEPTEPVFKEDEATRISYLIGTLSSRHAIERLLYRCASSDAILDDIMALVHELDYHSPAKSPDLDRMCDSSQESMYDNALRGLKSIIAQGDLDMADRIVDRLSIWKDVVAADELLLIGDCATTEVVKLGCGVSVSPEVTLACFRFAEKWKSRIPPALLALNRAIDQGDNDLVQLVLAYFKSFAEIDAAGRNALHILGQSEMYYDLDERTVQALVTLKDVHIDDTDLEGCTALHYAAKNGHIRLLKTLLDLGADPFPLNHSSKTPLCLAVSGKNLSCVQRLAEKLFEADPGQIQSLWFAATQLAAISHEVEILRALTHGVHELPVSYDLECSYLPVSLVGSSAGSLHETCLCYKVLHDVGVRVSSPFRLLRQAWETWGEHEDRNELFSNILKDYPEALEDYHEPLDSWDKIFRHPILGCAVIAGDADAVQYFHEKGASITYTYECGDNYLHTCMITLNRDLQDSDELRSYSFPSSRSIYSRQWRKLLLYLLRHISPNSRGRTGQSAFGLASRKTSQALIGEAGLKVEFVRGSHFSRVSYAIDSASWQEHSYSEVFSVLGTSDEWVDDAMIMEELRDVVHLVSDCLKYYERWEDCQQIWMKVAIEDWKIHRSLAIEEWKTHKRSSTVGFWNSNVTKDRPNDQIMLDLLEIADCMTQQGSQISALEILRRVLNEAWWLCNDPKVPDDHVNWYKERFGEDTMFFKRAVDLMDKTLRLPGAHVRIQAMAIVEEDRRMRRLGKVLEQVRDLKDLMQSLSSAAEPANLTWWTRTGLSRRHRR